MNVSDKPNPSEIFRTSGVRIQQKNHFKQHGLNHDERRDAAFCLKALQSGMLTSSNADPTFLTGKMQWRERKAKSSDSFDALPGIDEFVSR